VPSPQEAAGLSPCHDHRTGCCKLCRREGTKLFFKGARCLTEKCAVDRRPTAGPARPTGGGNRGRKQSEYAKQLREKQKVKRIYGLSERQFRNTFEEASRRPGVTGTNLLQELEARLDNLVYRMGFRREPPPGAAAGAARPHRVNGRRVNVPSYRAQPARKSASPPRAASWCRSRSPRSCAPRRADVMARREPREGRGQVHRSAGREQIPLNAQEQLIVELYSK
jgi:small subunit ribosomal protein S4